MAKKKKWIIFAAVGGALLAMLIHGVAWALILWEQNGTLDRYFPDPPATTYDAPMPTVTYGEFPLELEYTVNGETVVLQDTLICEFDGVKWISAQGNNRVWRGRYAGGNERLQVPTGDGCVVYWDIGPAALYMGDGDAEIGGAGDTKGAAREPYAKLCIVTSDGETAPTEQELLTRYNIRLVRFNIAEPIENEFRKQR